MATSTAAPYFYRVPDGETLTLPTFGTVQRPWRGRRAEYRALFRRQQYASVMALTVLRQHEQNGMEVLAGPRNPETNLTHPKVISVPTKRILAPDAIRALLEHEVAAQTDMTQAFVRRWRRFQDIEEMGADEVGSLVDAVVARKLGFDELFVHRTPEIAMCLASFTLGQSFVDYDPQQQTQTIEAIGMTNAALVVPSDTPAPKSASYLAMKWFGVEEFQQGYYNKDAMGMFPEFGMDALEMCVHGVCMATSSAVLRAGVEIVNLDQIA